MTEEKWNTVLFDRILKVKLCWENKPTEDGVRRSGTSTEAYDIELDAGMIGGIKPDISFSASLLPGELFHEVTLTIKNYKLPFDIRKYTKMEITAGYRRQHYRDEKLDETIVRVFPIEIFYSYCMSPAPDSVTIFKGIIVSSFVDNVKYYFTKDTNYIVTFYKDVTVIEYIQTIIDMLNRAGYSVSLVETIPMDVKSIYMKTGPRKEGEHGVNYRFSNVPNMFSSISSMLEAAYKHLGKEGSFNVNFVDGKIVIYCTDGYYSEDEKFVDLDSISSATLNAGVMNVTAPWYPPLIPGDIIRVSRKYIDGSDLPNAINADELMGVDNKYRILTMDIDFSSTGASNSMKITALPLKYVQDASSWKTDKEIDEYKSKWEVKEEEAAETIEKAKQNASKLVVKEIYKTDGEVKEEKKESEKIEQIPTVHMHVGEVPEDKNPLFKYVKENSGLFDGITLKKYGPMDADYNIASLCRDTLYKDFPSIDSVFEQVMAKGINVFFNSDIDGAYLWPLVLAATYRAYLDSNAKEHKENLEEFNPYKLFTHTVMVVLAGKNIMYPVISKWEDIKGPKFKGLYDAAAQLDTIPGGFAAKAILLNIGTVLNAID